MAVVVVVAGEEVEGQARPGVPAPPVEAARPKPPCPLFSIPVEYGEDPNPLPDPGWEGDPWNC